jgi:hypothetical protein
LFALASRNGSGAWWQLPLLQLPHEEAEHRLRNFKHLWAQARREELSLLVLITICREYAREADDSELPFPMLTSIQSSANIVKCLARTIKGNFKKVF